MTEVADRPLRADAARNAERILRAAREVYGELGPDAPIEAIARRAGVGERTLYRRFPTKGDLISAALDQSIAEDLTPVIEKARRAEDPMRGLGRADRSGDLTRCPRAPPVDRGPPRWVIDDRHLDRTGRSPRRARPPRPGGRRRACRSGRRGSAAPYRDALQRAVHDGLDHRWLATLRRPSGRRDIDR